MTSCSRQAGRALLAGTLLLAGCSSPVMRALTPEAVLIEGSHASHLTQHEPFRSKWNRTNYRYTAASVLLKWEAGPISIAAGEGVSLDGSSQFAAGEEIFTGRITYEIRLKK